MVIPTNRIIGSCQNQQATHQQRYQRLIDSGLLKGWESLFASTLLSCKAISRKDTEKLAEIEAKFQQDLL